MKFTIIAAMDKNRGIGKEGKIPWHLPEDLKNFKKITTKCPEGKVNVVIMGRLTWESLPEKYRPLPDRLNIVLTRNQDYEVPKGVNCADDFNALIDTLEIVKRAEPIHKVFVIGGGKVYEEAIKHKNCEKLILTKINATYHCDTFFPKSFKHTYDFSLKEFDDRCIHCTVDSFKRI